MMREVKQVNGVDDLLGWNVQVDNTEVISQSVTDEYYAA